MPQTAPNAGTNGALSLATRASTTAVLGAAVVSRATAAVMPYVAARRTRSTGWLSKRLSRALTAAGSSEAASL